LVYSLFVSRFWIYCWWYLWRTTFEKNQYPTTDIEWNTAYDLF